MIDKYIFIILENSVLCIDFTALKKYPEDVAIFKWQSIYGGYIYNIKWLSYNESTEKRIHLLVTMTNNFDINLYKFTKKQTENSYDITFIDSDIAIYEDPQNGGSFYFNKYIKYKTKYVNYKKLF